MNRRDDLKNTEKKAGPERAPETLKFYFTPVDEPRVGAPRNPHAKATTEGPEVVAALRAQFPDALRAVTEYAGETTVLVAAARIVDVCRYLREAHGFTYLIDLGGIDRFTDEERFEVFYNLVSLQSRKRIHLRVRVEEDHPVVPSVTPVFRAADWNERECWDMLGLRFEGHPDLRRMYMPEDFEYHPLRKEFPLLGIPGSLPLPAQTPGGELTLDPFPVAHGVRPAPSYEEPHLPADDSAGGEGH